MDDFISIVSNMFTEDRPLEIVYHEQHNFGSYHRIRSIEHESKAEFAIFHTNEDKHIPTRGKEILKRRCAWIDAFDFYEEYD